MPRLAMGLGFVALVVATACGSSSGSSPQPAPAGVAPTPSRLAAPRTIRSVAIRHNYVRLPVPSADLSNLVRLQGDTIEALTNGGAFEGQVFPSRSEDDGGSWVIDGPQFNGGGAASGPSVTDHLDVSSDHTLIAWGRGGNVIKTRAITEQDWRATGIGEVWRAHAVGRRLIVQLLDPRTGRRDLPGDVYVSRDDGRTWHLR